MQKYPRQTKGGDAALTPAPYLAPSVRCCGKNLMRAFWHGKEDIRCDRVSDPGIEQSTQLTFALPAPVFAARASG
jgi:hypothetical protein